MHLIGRTVSAILLFLFFLNIEGVNAMPQSLDKQEVRERLRGVRERYHIKAPDLPTNFTWLNVKRPLTNDDLRGKVVLLDFWTYCCINCMHIIPDLHYLEEKYKDKPFVVIGVHSAKFTNEQDADNIRQAILRYEIKHPVVVDQNFQIWQAYGTRAWPTLVLIDPDGYIASVFSGEGNRQAVDTYVDVLLEEFGKQGKLDPAPIPIDLEMTRRPFSILNYPGKVLADSAGQRLYISDSNNNRILVASLDGLLEKIIGSGKEGFRDGDFSTAEFRHPQGMAVYKDKLLIADTENHAIREVDFGSQTVRTIAGTGMQGFDREPSGNALNIALSSPWDLQVVGTKLYIAMAGLHQIWMLDLTSHQIENYAGSGREARKDGDRLDAAFAQPSGIASDGRFLYIADSEVSSVRAIDLQQDGEVSTLAGGDLFEYGDRDGKGEQVRLQHPLGIEYRKGKLYIADTYNHKLKILDLKTGRTASYLGNGKPGYEDGKTAQFYEPAGISALGDKLYVADTNNHRVRVVDVSSGDVGTLNISGLSKIAGKQKNAAMLTAGLPGTVVVNHPEQKISSGKFTLQVNIDLPPGEKFNPESPFQYLLVADAGVFHSPQANMIQSLEHGKSLLEIPVSVAGAFGRQNLRLEMLYYFCDDAETGTCKIRSVVHNIPVELNGSGSTVLTVTDKPGNELP